MSVINIRYNFAGRGCYKTAAAKHRQCFASEWRISHVENRTYNWKIQTVATVSERDRWFTIILGCRSISNDPSATLLTHSTRRSEDVSLQCISVRHLPQFLHVRVTSSTAQAGLLVRLRDGKRHFLKGNREGRLSRGGTLWWILTRGPGRGWERGRD